MSLLPVTVSDDVTIHFEIDQPKGKSSLEQTGRDWREQTEELTAVAFDVATRAMTAVAAKLRGAFLAAGADEAQVELNLKLDAEGNLIVAKTSAGAELKVTLVWKQ